MKTFLLRSGVALVGAVFLVVAVFVYIQIELKTPEEVEFITTSSSDQSPLKVVPTEQ